MRDSMTTAPPTKTKVSPTLRVLVGERPGEWFELSKEVTGIGRSQDRNEIVLSHQSVSRVHARVIRQLDGYLLIDEESRSGTYLNGVQISSPRRLRDGDKFQICDTVFRFEYPVVLEEDTSELATTLLGSRDLLGRHGLVDSEVNLRQKLAALADLGQISGQTLDLKAMLERTVECLFGIMPRADRGFVLLRDEVSSQLVPMALARRPTLHANPQLSDNLRISQTLVGQVMTEGRALLVSDVRTDPRVRMTDSLADTSVRTLICVPLMNRDRHPIGILQIETTQSYGAFTQEDLDLLVVVSHQINAAIENIRLHQRLIQHAKVVAENESARRVQLLFLPRSAPSIPSYEFWHHYEPAQAVGGDYFQYFSTSRPGSNSERKALAVVMGDVSGHGLPAALIMSRLAVETKVALASATDPIRVIETLNEEFCQDDLEGFFVTFLMLWLEPESGDLVLIRAGHPVPWIRRVDGTVEPMTRERGGLPLGVAAGRSYTAFRLTLTPGEIIVAYTDGVIEAQNSAGGMFGAEVMSDVIRGGRTAAEVGQSLVRAIRHHLGGNNPSDDLTLVCFGRDPA